MAGQFEVSKERGGLSAVKTRVPQLLAAVAAVGARIVSSAAPTGVRGRVLAASAATLVDVAYDKLLRIFVANYRVAWPKSLAKNSICILNQERVHDQKNFPGLISFSEAKRDIIHCVKFL